MSARTERRRADLLDALATSPLAMECEMAKRLGRPTLFVMLDLFRLENAGRVVAESVAVDGGYKIVYRLPAAARDAKTGD